MGKTASVANLLNRDASFQNFLAQATSALLAKAATDLATFNAGTTSFYSMNGWDEQPMAVGQNFNYQLSDESSANIIAAMITNIGANVFGSAGGPLPEGTTVNAKGIDAAAGSFSGFEKLAVDAAIAVVSNALASFALDDDGYNTITIHQSIAPGATLHLCAFTENSALQQPGKTDTLMASMFSYQLIYSLKQAQQQQDEEYIQEQERLIAKLVSTQTLVQQRYNDAVAGGSFQQKAAQLHDLLGTIAGAIANYQAEIDAVKTKIASGQFK